MNIILLLPKDDRDWCVYCAQHCGDLQRDVCDFFFFFAVASGEIQYECYLTPTERKYSSRKFYFRPDDLSHGQTATVQFALLIHFWLFLPIISAKIHSVIRCKVAITKLQQNTLQIYRLSLRIISKVFES